MSRSPLPLIVAAVGILIFLASTGQKPAASSPAPSKPVAVTQPTREAEIKLLDFWAPWCGPCVAMKPTVKKLENEGVTVEALNQNEDAGKAKAAEFGVHDLPTFIVTRDGKEVARQVGATTLDSLRKLVGNARKASTQGVKRVSAPEKIDTLAAPAKVKPVEKPAIVAEPHKGPEGWRLRLYYPRGDDRGPVITKQLNGMKAIAAKYGFEAFTTDEASFAVWGDQLKADRLTLVLIHPEGWIVWKESENIPTDPIELRETIRNKARDSWGSL